MTTTSDLVPEDLLPAIEAAAKEDRRPPRELVAEAIERYLGQRQYFRADDAHRKIEKGLTSLQQGKVLDGEAVMNELLAELDPPS